LRIEPSPRRWQRYLCRLINEKEIEDSFPLGPGKEPGRSAYDTSRVDSTGISRFLDVPQATIVEKQGAFGFTTDFDSLKTLARSLRRFAGGGEKIHHGLMLLDATPTFLPAARSDVT